MTDEKNRLSYVCTPAHLQTQPAMTSALREGGMEGGEEKRREEKRREEKRREEKRAIIKGIEEHEKVGEGEKTMMAQCEASTFLFFFFPLFFYNEKSVHHYHSQPLNAAMKQINNQFVPEYTKAKPYTRYINTDMHAQVRAHTAHSKFEPGTIGMVCFGLPEPL